jgi:hypothetical protein
MFSTLPRVLLAHYNGRGRIRTHIILAPKASAYIRSATRPIRGAPPLRFELRQPLGLKSLSKRPPYQIRTRRLSMATITRPTTRGPRICSTLYHTRHILLHPLPQCSESIHHKCSVLSFHRRDRSLPTHFECARVWASITIMCLPYISLSVLRTRFGKSRQNKKFGNVCAPLF